MEKSSSRILELVKQELSQISNKYDLASLMKYGKDYINYYTPNPSIVLFPKKISQVIEIIKFANKHSVSVVPSGGRTGLSGGATATNGEIVLSLEKMNLIKINQVEGSVTVEAGAITQIVQERVAAKGFLFPVDFASKGSSQIGGNISTNVGGIHVIKYGMFRNWITGITVVTGEGKLLNLNKGLIKNATGYDLRQLFIGSEGTLGVIVSAIIKLEKIPSNRRVLLISVSELKYLLSILVKIRKVAVIRAFEFFSINANKYLKDLEYYRFLLNDGCEAHAIIEYEKTTVDVENDLYKVLEEFEEKKIILSNYSSEDLNIINKIWKLREDLPTSISNFNPYKNDLSIRIAFIPRFIKDLDKVLKINYGDFEVLWFGHIGDGNIHINILKPDKTELEDFKLICEKVNITIAELIEKYQGSISAEHGVGLLKREFLASSRTTIEVEYMKQIKKVFDPNGILNPGKVFTIKNY